MLLAESVDIGKSAFNQYIRVLYMKLEMQNKKGQIGKSTQSFLKYPKSNDCVVLDDGACAIIAVSSTNFDLKSQDEQNSIILIFRGF